MKRIGMDFFLNRPHSKNRISTALTWTWHMIHQPFQNIYNCTDYIMHKPVIYREYYNKNKNKKEGAGPFHAKSKSRCSFGFGQQLGFGQQPSLGQMSDMEVTAAEATSP